MLLGKFRQPVIAISPKKKKAFHYFPATLAIHVGAFGEEEGKTKTLTILTTSTTWLKCALVFVQRISTETLEFYL